MACGATATGQLHESYKHGKVGVPHFDHAPSAPPDKSVQQPERVLVFYSYIHHHGSYAFRSIYVHSIAFHSLLEIQDYAAAVNVPRCHAAQSLVAMVAVRHSAFGSKVVRCRDATAIDVRQALVRFSMCHGASFPCRGGQCLPSCDVICGRSYDVDVLEFNEPLRC